MVIINLRNISQHQSPPRPEVVLCNSPTYEAEPKHMCLYVVCECDLPQYMVLVTTVAGYHRWRLHLLAVQAYDRTGQVSCHEYSSKDHDGMRLELGYANAD
jgi:hypothetical protein